MRRAAQDRRARTRSSHLGQLLAGLVALPLSALPFVGYGNLTPEGRLVRDRVIVAVAPPSLPTLTARQVAAARAAVPRYEGAVMALAYHGIGSASDAEGGFVVSPRRFAEHLATLRAAGMRTVTAAQVARAFTGGSALPPKAVMISFDDGRSDAMLFADPLLAKARMSATMFVITGAASKPGIYYASWDKLEGYARSGRWDLQAHTDQLHRDQEAAGGKNLPALTSLKPGESLTGYRDRIRTDLARSGDAVEDHAGRRPTAFAYPFGAYGADRTNDPAIRQILREEVSRRYPVAFHQDDQETIPLLTGDQDPLGLRRLEVGDWSGPKLLERVADAVGRIAHPVPPTATISDLLLGELAAAPHSEPPPDTSAGQPVAAGPTPPPTASPLRPSVTRLPSLQPGPPSSPGVAPPTSDPPTIDPTSTTTTTTPRTTTTTSTTTTSTTTTTTTTTTVQPGCRSQGRGNVCH